MSKFDKYLASLNEDIQKNNTMFSFNVGSIDIYSNNTKIAVIKSDKFKSQSLNVIGIIKDALSIQNENIVYYTIDNDEFVKANLQVKIKDKTIQYIVSYVIDGNSITHRYSFDVTFINFKG